MRQGEEEEIRRGEELEKVAEHETGRNRSKKKEKKQETEE